MERIQALDFTKGSLVVLMVIYHSLNYLGFYFAPHKYLAFLTPSFIMITGFLISKNYSAKYQIEPCITSKRLSLRSLKLLLIFTFLNILANTILSKNHYGISLGLGKFIDGWVSIFLIGNAHNVAFDVLLPIGYLLFTSIFILKIQIKNPYFLGSIATILFILCVTLEIYISSISILTLFSFGIMGMTIGLIPLNTIQRILSHKMSLLLLSSLYMLIFLCLPDKYYVQIALTTIALSIFYGIGIRIYIYSYVFKPFALIGKYSLFSYIFQIIFIKIILDCTNHFKIVQPRALGLIAITTVSVFTVTVCLNYLREKNMYIKAFYETIFT